MKNHSRIIASASLLIGLAAVGVLAFGTPVLSADIPYSGKVFKVDAAQHQMIVKNPASGGRLKFTVPDGAAITAGNEKKTFGDIKPGEAVDIEYAMEGGKYIAHKVVLKPSGKK